MTHIKNMRTILLFITTILLLHPPLTAFAHGGFEKRAGDTVVYVTQTPISPFVGEKVTINMVFQKYDTFDRWKNTDIHIKLIDTFYGDETKDKTIYTRTETTDVNGSVNFSYTFEKENYFDLDISFINPQTGKVEETGFLIQPRRRSVWALSSQAQQISLLTLALGVAVGILLIWRRGKNTETRTLPQENTQLAHKGQK